MTTKKLPGAKLEEAGFSASSPGVYMAASGEVALIIQESRGQWEAELEIETFSGCLRTRCNVPKDFEQAKAVADWIKGVK